MNNTYIKQIFEEGLATTFYQKPKKIIENKIKNKQLTKLLITILSIIYVLFLMIIIIVVFNLNFPF